MVPSFWLPITTYLFLRSLFQFTGPLPAFTSNPYLPLASILEIPAESYVKVLSCCLLGNFVWTILEYVLHRFLFHLDEYLPDANYALTLHFLLHGVHHYLPMDRLRLVMPPVLFTVLQFPFTQLAYKLFPVAVANGVIAGAFTFCKSPRIVYMRCPELCHQMSCMTACIMRKFDRAFSLRELSHTYLGSIIQICQRT